MCDVRAGGLLLQGTRGQTSLPPRTPLGPLPTPAGSLSPYSAFPVPSVSPPRSWQVPWSDFWTPATLPALLSALSPEHALVTPGAPGPQLSPPARGPRAALQENFLEVEKAR